MVPQQAALLNPESLVAEVEDFLRNNPGRN